MSGWAKVEGCCRQASRDGWRYCWIDSCCIDKSSSAELSEAINSMFEWYRRAEVCYAYLSDVNYLKKHNSIIEQDFKKSAWFTRGWTLQELLAPQWVEFYDINWQEIGTKSSLSSLIESITGISYIFDYANATVAQKMSWASLRQTTRVEDQAYCLLGIFGVHMPPLYGEGMNAFHRLQMEIISQSDDMSIFAWEGRSNVKAGILATSPRQFQFSGDVVPCGESLMLAPYSMTNQGLRLELDLIEVKDPNASRMIPPPTRMFLAPLLFTRRSEPYKQMALPLLPFLDLPGVWPHKSRSWSRRGKLVMIPHSYSNPEFVRTTIYADILKPTPVFSRPQCVVVKFSEPWEPPFVVQRRITPKSDASWSANRSEGEILTSFYNEYELGALVYRDSNSMTFAVLLGSNKFVFCIDIVVDEDILQQLRSASDDELGDLVGGNMSPGCSDRIVKKLPDGRVVSAMTKKEQRGHAYRFVVDIAISRAGKAKPGDLEFSRFHKGEIALDGAFTWG